jgi:DNA-binding transcriptional LysR family regulator
MKKALLSEGGLSLDRLRSLLAVAACGSIVKAADYDPVRQSQYSRQIKELESFFQTRLVERKGKGIELTQPGRELARISRFFMMSLGNFQRGCLSEEQTYRIGGGATFISEFLLPVIAEESAVRSNIQYQLERTLEEDIERRLHDLTLEFGVVERPALSRPLQTRKIVEWNLCLLVPGQLPKSARRGSRVAFPLELPLALPAREAGEVSAHLAERAPRTLMCDSFLEVRRAVESGKFAGLLPKFMADVADSSRYCRMKVPHLPGASFGQWLAWNPRLLRLNTHATRRLEWLFAALKATCAARPS